MKTYYIARIAVQELLYEKATYLLFGFAVFSLGLSCILGQLTYAEQAKITLDFMLGATHATLLLFSVFMGISLFQKELSLGSISMVLSKPIRRGSFLLGKYIGQCLTQFVSAFIMGAITALFYLRLSTGEVPYLPIFQTVTFIALEAAVLTAMTYIFSIYSGAIVTAMSTITLFVLGHSREIVQTTIGEKENFTLWVLVKNLIPDLEIFNIKTLASYGQAIPIADFCLACIYGGVCIAFYLTVAILLFNQRDIAT